MSDAASDTVPDRSTARLAPWLLGAAWAALVFGLLEGLILAAARLDPKILAPTKVSNDIIWMAPLVHLVVYAAIAVVLAVAYRFLPQRLRHTPALRVALPIFVFLGAFNALVSPRLSNSVSTAILALGLGVAAARLVRGKEDRLENWMRRRLPWIPISIAVVAAGVQVHAAVRERRAAGAIAAAPSEAVNVLILMLDTVRRDRFTADRAPNLMRLAEQGAWFNDAWSTSSWSLPTQVSALTGLHGYQHEAQFPSIALASDALTLGEWFMRRGYATGAFSNNSAWITPEHMGRGFVRFQTYSAGDIITRTVLGRMSERVFTALGWHKAGRGKHQTTLTSQFLEFLDDYQQRPFFAYLCYMDVNRSFHRRALGHAFWEEPAEPIEVLASYDSALTALDAHLGELLAELDRRRILDRTLIVVTSDHGESFGAGVLDDHDPHGHASSLYPEQLRVPLFFVLPGTIAPEQRIDRPASIRSIPATITALLGESSPAFPGEPLLTTKDTASVPLLATLDYVERRARSVITGDWQYIAYPKEPDREELFDRSTDPAAKHSVRESSQLMLRARAALDSLMPVEEQRLTP